MAWPSAAGWASPSSPRCAALSDRPGGPPDPGIPARIAVGCAVVIVRPPLPVPESWSLGDLERMRLVLRGGSIIDWRRLHFQSKEDVDHYLRLCLFEPDDPFDRARLQRILDEAVEYLRTSFRYRVPEEGAHPSNVHALFLLA